MPSLLQILAAVVSRTATRWAVLIILANVTLGVGGSSLTFESAGLSQLTAFPSVTAESMHWSSGGRSLSPPFRHPGSTYAPDSAANPSAAGTSPKPEGDVFATSSPPEYDYRAIEKDVHRLVNRERTDRRLPPLTWVDSLRTLSLVHSRDMRDRDFFGHTSPDGETVNDRADMLGLYCRRIDGNTVYGFGENLYKATLYVQYRDFYEGDQFLRREYEWKTEAGIAQEIVDGWMNSPGHRKNILTKGYDVEAIGIVADRERFYVTQVFC